MSQADAAFAEARAALASFGLPAILPALHDAGISISRSVLGGSHSVAVYPPIDSFVPTDAATMAASDLGDRTSLYIHIPFCETRCTFCHYAVQHYGGGAGETAAPVHRYNEALKREIGFWGARAAGSSAVSSIYIGGGTPLVLEQGALIDILATVRGHFDVLGDADICVEGSPLTITAAGGEEKLLGLRAAGVNRLSFGVQSFDDAVLRYAARGYKGDVAIRASQIAAAVFDNWNVDLIQSLYKGSPDEILGNLCALAALLPPHLTWYHGRFADRPQGDWYKSGSRHASFETEAETLLGRMLIWCGTTELGYTRSDGNRFAREDRHVDPFKAVRTSLASNLLGMGASAYSHVESRDRAGGTFGHAWRNEANIDAYVDRVAAGGAPIATGRRIDAEEVIAMSYATGLRRGRVENDTLALAASIRPGLATDYDRRMRRLLDLGVLERYVRADQRAGVRLSDLGRLFEDEILASFFSPAVRSALDRDLVAPAPEALRTKGRAKRLVLTNAG
ncbi:coproporphyrinogen-III oxidase family protein [Sphingomonas sp.]|jgi:coproporphyrinogen III oxidase-like Fe-S oxidoreductase|uniref:coproporphyrinogen-III oxidase family protein n=1 Tax=Sphingomonas sp. TaxID=28214 RepID=UPI002E3335F8|nr:radical SAM protein [Sphingomonas sp.]HEX4693581.1 radical SAM protein [Sphingomonas sp.]